MATQTKTRPAFRWKFRRAKPDNDGIPSAWRLAGRTYAFFLANRKVLGAITLVYAAFYFLLVRAAPQVDLGEYEILINEFIGDGSQTVKTFTLAGLALASAGTGASQIQLVYGLVLLVVFSLAYIWTLRHILAKKRFNLRDSFYRSQTPLVPYLALLLLMSLQLLPLALGGFLYAIVTTQNIAVTAWENLLFGGLWLGLGLLSAYWLVNSLMASYAVTLPGMYPLAALRATHKLVKGRRWYLLRKILFLPLALFLLFALVFLFLVAVAPKAVFWFYDISIIIALPVVHIYYYKLYRSLV